MSPMSPSKIMIVDDELSMRMNVQMMLDEQPYETLLFAHSTELFKALETIQPDLIILDVIMPDMDGFEVCQRVKANPKWQHIPIILVTVLDAKQALIKGTEAGADDFLQKPLNKLELLARVRSMLRIKRQYDELEATLKLREELSNMVVHDMSSLITSLLLHSTLLEEQITEPEQREHLDMVKSSAERLDAFVNDMLMMAKMEHSKLLVHRELVDVRALTQDVVKGFDIIARSRKISLTQDLPTTTLKLSLDSNLFRRVISNLLANALKYSPGDTQVLVRLEYLRREHDSRHHLRLEVIDEGPGIPEKDRERIFNKFEVIDLKKKGVQQIGLGLSFCKMAVDAHEGNIYVTDNQPSGCRFVVEI